MHIQAPSGPPTNYFKAMLVFQHWEDRQRGEKARCQRMVGYSCYILYFPLSWSSLPTSSRFGLLSTFCGIIQPVKEIPSQTVDLFFFFFFQLFRRWEWSTDLRMTMK